MPLCLRRALTLRYLSTTAARRSSPTGSAKLFEDAAREEAEELESNKSSSHVHERPDEINWTGDERLQDTVLRMLMDKYKPLRTGNIQTAEQKLHKSPPSVQQYNPDVPSPTLTAPPTITLPPGSSWASIPLLPPGPPNHKPWHTEFKVPDHAKASVRLARFPLAAPAPRASLKDDLEIAQKAEHELHKKLGRVSRARESTLDYRLGLNAQGKQASIRVNPVSVKGWTSLVDDRIEKARRAGVFASIKGRGKPIERSADEANPFIAREEFLMNRIVKRNGAAPPWVQLQAELDQALHTFRHLLLEGWTRYAVRALTTDGLGTAPARARAFRDPRWATREAAYHAVALAEVNSLVRQYNTLAPYAVRRPLHTLDAELAGVYERAEEDITRALAERTAVVPPQRVRRPREGAEVVVVDWVAWMRRLCDRVMSALRRIAGTR